MIQDEKHFWKEKIMTSSSAYSNPLGGSQQQQGVKNVIGAVDFILFLSLGFLPSSMAPFETTQEMQIQKHLFTLVILTSAEKTCNIPKISQITCSIQPFT